MRILDLLRMSSSSLWKRKFRSVLTILGVMIGTASIVVMVSLGLGLNRATMEDIERYGGLTTIEVREGRGDGSGSEDQVVRLDDDAVEIIPCRISGEGSYNNYQPYIAEGERRERIVDRITQYSEELGEIELNFR